jgi:outer membrane lipoprotein SlyB
VPVEISRGVNEQIVPTQIVPNQHSGVGAVLGSLIGGGTWRDVGMAPSAFGGAMAGNEVLRKNDQPIPAQQIIVRTTSGSACGHCTAQRPEPARRPDGLPVGQWRRRARVTLE